MKKIGFDNEKYIELQSKYIKERVDSFGDKLYLELGGKLFDDFHASRVLPGFEPDSKMKMLKRLSDKIEIVIAISAVDLVRNKVRNDYNITYDLDTIRLIETFKREGFYVGSVVITKYTGQKAADSFKIKLENMGIKVYILNYIEGYPSNLDFIASDEGFGKNDYIETSRPIIVFTAPGPGSGKMTACMSQLYQEHKRGIKAGYAKFETFPVWNLPLKHPINLAYEAATIDLDDVNMIDPFHLEAYGETTVNYNRDIESFPVLNSLFEKILGKSPYKSPTDMGVNMVGNCIVDEKVVSEASMDEIVRRYYQVLKDKLNGKLSEEIFYKMELLIQQSGVDINRRKVVKYSLEKEKNSGTYSSAVELSDGKIIQGRTTNSLSAVSSAILNSLKYLANVEEHKHLISPEVLIPLQDLKRNQLKGVSRLNIDETLIALSICAANNFNAKRALDCIPKLNGVELHSTVLLEQSEETMLKKLGVNLTCEPKYRKIEVINEVKDMKKEDVIVPCNTSELQVYTKDGYKRIEDLKIGDIVLNHKNKESKIKSIVCHENLVVWEVHTLNGYILKVHSFMPFYRSISMDTFYSDSDVLFVKDLRVGDYLVSLMNKDFSKNRNYNYDKITCVNKTNEKSNFYDIVFDGDEKTYIMNDKIVCSLDM